MNLIDYDQEGIMPMYNPPHPGESLRGALDNTGWTVTECAARLGVARNTLSRVLNGSVGISANMALALEGIGWSNAEYWMRRQATYDLAQARRTQEVATWIKRTNQIRNDSRLKRPCQRRRWKEKTA